MGDGCICKKEVHTTPRVASPGVAIGQLQGTELMQSTRVKANPPVRGMGSVTGALSAAMSGIGLTIGGGLVPTQQPTDQKPTKYNITEFKKMESKL